MMDYDFIPKDVTQFILNTIDSVAQLEGLLLLRNEPQVEWDAAALSKRLYISEKETAEVLAQLTRDGFLLASADRPPRYRYQPESPELREMVDRVAQVYAKYLVPVTNLIHAKPKSKVQQFADAFKLRKEE